jgi:molecular chaperone DnaJ
MTTMKSEWAERDLYDELGVAPTSSAQEITSAYRNLARRLHPDSGTADGHGQGRFRDVARAYEVLGRNETRRNYDEGRLARARGGPRPGHSSARSSDRPSKATDAPVAPPVLRLSLGDAVFGTTASLSGPGGEVLRVRVPPGVRDGQSVRLPGRRSLGGETRDGASLIVRVSAHPYFTRKGHDLLLSVPVTYPELALGADIDVPTLDGQLLSVRVAAGTSSGRNFRLKGLGAPIGTGGRGDLVVTFQLAVSVEPSNRERRALQALARATPAPRTALMDSTLRSPADARPGRAPAGDQG